MNRPAAQSLWRAAPARLLRTPGWLALLLVAATLLVASVVAPPLFAATAGATSLDTGLRATEGNPYGPESADARVIWNGVLPADAEAEVVERLDALPSYSTPTLGASGVGQSRTQRAVAFAGDRLEPSVLWTHDGVLEALAAEGGADPDAEGVWLRTDIAEALGLEVGDPFRIGLYQPIFDSRTAAPTVLLGTYEAAAGSSLPAAAADLPDADRWFVPTDADLPGVGAPLAVTNRATFDKLVLAVWETPLYTADMVLDPDVTPDEAERASAALARLARDAFDPGNRLNTNLATAEPEGAELDVGTGLAEIAAEASGTASSAREQVQAYAVGGQALAALLLVAAWVLLGLSRRREQLIASGLGMRPVEVAGLAMLETLVVVLLAVPAGIGLACLGVLLAGPPSEVGLPVGTSDLVRGGVAAFAGLLLVGLTAGVTAVGTDRMDRLTRLGRGRRSVPWGAALLAATAVVAVAVVTVDVDDRSSTPLTMVFPILVAASVAMLVARAAAALRARRPGRARPGTARWLATRRTGPVVREVTALTAVLAVALGLFAYSLTVHRGVDEGVEDKTASLLGARSTVVVENAFRGQGRRVATTAPFDGSTIVWRRGVTLPPAFGQGPLLAIDVPTFAGVADWGGSGDLEAGRALLDRLDEKSRGLPVILVGDTDLAPGDEGTMTVDVGTDAPVRVVDVLDAFPGAESEAGAVTVVMSVRKLFKVLNLEVDFRREGADADDAGAFTSEVWSDTSAAGLRAGLAAQDIRTDALIATEERTRSANGLVASTWAAGYVLALGGVVLALALAAGLVLALRLADRDRVSDVLLLRMGYAARDLARARAWEVGYAVGTAVLAAALGAAVLVLAPTTIDAAAGIPPLTRPRPGVADGLALVAVLVVLVLAAWSAGTVLARRRAAAEVLRGGG